MRQVFQTDCQIKLMYVNSFHSRQTTLRNCLIRFCNLKGNYSEFESQLQSDRDYMARIFLTSINQRCTKLKITAVYTPFLNYIIRLNSN